MALTIGTGLTIGGGITFGAIFPPTWTWDSAYLGPYITLSNGNLVATADSGMVGFPAVLGTWTIPTGSKIMFSMCALAVINPADTGIGVGSHAMNLAGYIGIDFATSQGVYGDGANFTQAAGSPTTGLTYESLTTIDIAIDRVNGLFWYRVGAPGGMSAWNDDGGANPVIATGGYAISDLVGTIYPAVGPYYNVAATPSTGSFGANYEPGGAVPEGFTFAPATAPVWTWSSVGGTLGRTFSNRTVYNDDVTVYSALGNYAIADTARIMFSVQVTNQSAAFSYQIVGFGTSATNLNAALGSYATSMGAFSNGNVYWNSELQYSGLPTFVAGDVIDVAMQGSYFSPGWWYRVNGGDWNGNPAADPSTNTSSLFQLVNDSPLYPAVTLNGGVITIQDVPVYPVPAGFTFLGTSQIPA